MFIHYGAITYLMANLPKFCVNKNVACKIIKLYKMGVNGVITIFLRSTNIDEINSIKDMLLSLIDNEYVEENEL